MSIQFGDIDDAVLATQENLIRRGAFLDMQTDLTDHVAVREVWKNRQHKFNGGDVWRFQAQVDQNYSARAVGLYETDGASLNDTLIQGEMTARHINASYIYDVREPDFQKGGHAIVDLVKTRYTAMMVSFYEYLETVLWGKPASTSDKLTPAGIDYWVTKGAAEGFTGVDPIFTDLTTEGRAGITFASQARWANWSAPYVAVTKEDLIRKMRTGHRKTQFRSPVSHAQPTVGPTSNGIYTNSDVIGIMEEVLESQNMNLGNDVASRDGRTLFKGTPLTYAPKLDDDSSDPVYLLDWNWLAVGVMPGWEEQLTKPYMVPNKHTVRRVDLDATLQMVCTNLRKQTVFHIA